MTTLDLYHRTSEDAARAIVATGRFLTRENTPEAYVSTHVDGEAAGYGSAVVHVRVDEADAQLEDEFPDGELHYRIPLDRAEVVGALKAVDYVVLFGEKTAETIIAKVRPDVYVKGGDYTLETLPEAKIVQSYGGCVEFVQMVAGRSTTNVIKKIEQLQEQEGEA